MDLCSCAYVPLFIIVWIAPCGKVVILPCIRTGFDHSSCVLLDGVCVGLVLQFNHSSATVIFRKSAGFELWELRADHHL